MRSGVRKLLARLANLRLAVIAHDLVMVWAGWIAARALTTSGSQGFNLPLRALFLPEMVWIIVIQGLVFWYIGLYRGLWRFASLPDLWNLVRGALIGTLLVGLVLWLSGFSLIQRNPALLLVYPVSLVLFLGTPRIIYRSWKDATRQERKSLQQIRTVILGAGHTGAVLVRELQRDPQYLVLGLLDDNPVLRNTRVHGVRVFGGIDRLDSLAREMDVQLAIIAMPGGDGEQMQRVVDICETAGVEIKTIPRLQDFDQRLRQESTGIKNRRRSAASIMESLKTVTLEDLFGRTGIELDWQSLQAGITGKRILITGGGGSIGSELAELVLKLQPSHLTILDRSELNLYQVTRRLQAAGGEAPVDYCLGDILDKVYLDRVLAERSPQMILHTAAYKHLPMLQSHLRAAVQNNIIGTRRVADAAVRHAADSLVLISTDKAVNPQNTMGITKRIAELYCNYYNNQSNKINSSTKFITVRFGNVLDSTGSVVPLFRQQISAGGPVTVTHPDMRRYFMSMREAGLLILQAAVIGMGGEVFVLDMGEPVRIRALADQLIRLAGLRPDVDVPIIYTGLRPGEKLEEELFHTGEARRRTGHDMILQAMPPALDLGRMPELLDRLEALLADGAGDGELNKLLERLLDWPPVPAEARA